VIVIKGFRMAKKKIDMDYGDNVWFYIGKHLLSGKVEGMTSGFVALSVTVRVDRDTIVIKDKCDLFFTKKKAKQDCFCKY